MWSGNYKNWKEANQDSLGYDDAQILEERKAAVLKVKNGEAVFEREGVLYPEIQYSWGVLAGLQKAAIENGNKLCVIDFGGSLGSTFYQNREFLQGLDQIEWCIVEQKHFVDAGKEQFENDQLKFYYSIEEALQYHKPNVLLLSSVVNYLEYAYKWMEQFSALELSYIIVDRTSFIESKEDVITVQKTNEASYPCWFFNEAKFIKRLKRYNKIGDFSLAENNTAVINESVNVYWKGFIFQLK